MNQVAGLKRVLIFDDDADFRKLLITYLRKLLEGVELEEYDPVARGVPGETFDWSRYDVLILDYYLCIHNVTGLDILQANRKNKNFPAAIMLTGAGNEETAVRALKAGVYDYLRKEKLDKQQLRASILDAFEKHKEEMHRRSELTNQSNAFNKALFYQQLEHPEHELGKPGRILLLLQLDDHEALEDRLGIILRDNVVRHIAKQSYEVFQMGECDPHITRLSDHAVALLINDPGSRKTLEFNLQGLCNHLRKHPYRFEEKKFRFTVSIGVVTVPPEGASAEMLIHQAREASTAAAATGGNSFRIYEDLPRPELVKPQPQPEPEPVIEIPAEVAVPAATDTASADELLPAIEFPVEVVPEASEPAPSAPDLDMEIDEQESTQPQVKSAVPSAAVPLIEFPADLDAPPAMDPAPEQPVAVEVAPPPPAPAVPAPAKAPALELSLPEIEHPAPPVAVPPTRPAVAAPELSLEPVDGEAAPDPERMLEVPTIAAAAPKKASPELSLEPLELEPTSLPPPAPAAPVAKGPEARFVPPARPAPAPQAAPARPAATPARPAPQPRAEIAKPIAVPAAPAVPRAAPTPAPVAPVAKAPPVSTKPAPVPAKAPPAPPPAAITAKAPAAQPAPAPAPAAVPAAPPPKPASKEELDEATLSATALKLKKAFDEKRVIQNFEPVISLRSEESDEEMHVVCLQLIDTAGKAVEEKAIYADADTPAMLKFIDRWLLRETIGRVVNSDNSNYVFLLKVGAASLSDPGLFNWLRKALTGLDAKRPGKSIALEVAAADFELEKKKAAALISYLSGSHGFRFALGGFTAPDQFKALGPKPGVHMLRMSWELFATLRKEPAPEGGVQILKQLQDAGLEIIVEQIKDSTTLTDAIGGGASYAMGPFIGEPTSRLDDKTNVESFEIA